MTNLMPREGEVVLIYYLDKPSFYARIESIEADIKKGWYQVTLLLLTIPSQTVTWILRESYIAGEPFTMSGKPVRLEALKGISVKTKPNEPNKSDVNKNSKRRGRVIPFRKPQR